MSSKPELRDIIKDAFNAGVMSVPIVEFRQDHQTSVVDLLFENAQLKSDLSDANDTVANYLREIRSLDAKLALK